MSLKDLTVCLYTSTKGHFGRKDIYRETVLSLLEQIGPRQCDLLAHIKIDPGESAVAEEMEKWLQSFGFTVISSLGGWKHGDNSHQIEYLKDQMTVNESIKTQFFLHLEDDWIIKSSMFGSSAASFLLYGMECLNDPKIVQVRIPRYVNEPDRIRGLMARHGIDGRVGPLRNGVYLCNDWSNNPFVARTRDIRAALTFVVNSNLPRHSEHGVGRAMGMLGWAELPFAFFDPKMVRCYHRGTPVGQEDSLDKELVV